MQRWLSILLGVGAFALAVVVVVRSMDTKPAEPHATLARDAAPPAGPHDAAKVDAATVPDAGLASEARDPGAGFAHFPDGRPVPPLPDGSPKHVRLGVVLMSFAGAQGASPTARDRKEALALATKLAGDAKTDFHAAVVRGDSGSSDDVGRIPRGVLEPATEYTVFTMPVGGVSDPIETPRGYWIAKRTE